jgi:iron complex outermembrane recepter protein
VRISTWAVMAAGCCLSFEAAAQRVADNAVKAADDAFGTTVGNEQTGLYNPYEARGFSPVDAGNVRIEGLYFDQQSQLNSHVGRGNTVRVGISAQSYAFPAPTGVADFSLRFPGDKTIVSAMVGGGQYDTWVVEVDAQTPLTSKLSVGAGMGAIRIDNQEASKNFQWTYGTIFRLTPDDNSEVSGFWSELDDCHNEQQTRILPAGGWAPPEVKRHTFFGQGWSSGHCREANGGFLGRYNFGDDWRLRAGVFRSQRIQHKGYGDFMRDVQPDGTGQHYFSKTPRSAFISYSGEVRLTKVLTTGDFRHTIDGSIRGRDVDRLFGGSDTEYVGPGRIGLQIGYPEPVWSFGPQTSNQTKQAAAGISYFGQWAGVGGMTLGASKVDYRRDTFAPGLPATRATDKPWLYNAGVNAFLSESLAAYGGYTRGLEETGNAPDVAANNGEPMPAAITKQIDAGLRYTIKPGMNLVAGVFEVKKPYFNLDRANVWGPFGEVRHRGIEASLAGQPFEGLNVVAGIMLLQARVRGDAVDRGLLGKVPVGQFPRNSLIQIQYQPAAWNGFGIDMSFYEGGGQMTVPDNSFKSDGYRQLNAGIRYYFKIGKAPASFRANVYNITNAYDWNIGGAGAWFPRSNRRYTFNLAADF